MRWRWWKRPNATFDATPRPIDLMFLDMLNAGATPTVSRDEALSVPAVQRARNMICSIATLPLVQVGPDRTRVPNPLFDQFDPAVANVVTLAQTVEDLLFEAIAWWQVTETGWDKYPVKVRRVDPGTVSLQPPGDGRTPAPVPSGVDPRGGIVWIDGRPVSAAEVIRFDSPNPAVLKVGGRAIKRALLLEQAARMYADDPRPLDYFTPAEGADPIPDEEIRAILAEWKAARKKRSTAYVPASLKYNTVDVPTPADLQLVELQKDAALDVANVMGIDPEDVGVSTTSRTYQNATDRRQDRINDVLSPYMRAITDRLSMGDVTRRGYRVVFDLDDYMKADPTTRWGVYSVAKGLGVMDGDAIAAKEGLPAPTGAEPVPVPEAPPAAVDASRRAGHTFDAPGLTFTDLPMQTFAVDATARTIEGLAMPYGPVGFKGGMKFRFARNSLVWSDVSRVKLLRDHDPSTPLGRAVSLKHTSAGLAVKFKVARGAAGDEALALAEDGVLDGLSAGVDFDLAADTTPDPKDRSVTVVRRATLRETSLTALPAFDDARLTAVRASRGETGMDPEQNEPQAPVTPEPAPVPMTFTAEQFDTLMTRLSPPAAAAEPDGEGRQLVDPTRPPTTTTFVREPVPYRFDRGGNFTPGQQFVFSADLHEMALCGDTTGTTDAGKRVMGLLAAQFATVSTDINELNPTINRPDMYVDQRDYRTPLWDFVNRGAPPNGVQPFGFPKYNTSSGLLGDHTEGTEPTAGAFTTTSQTITPTALSGKASLTREVWDMGGNPAVSTLIFNQMKRAWRESLESATATFLNTLGAAVDIDLGAGVVDEALAAAWDAALADLQFVRGYDFSAFALEKELYKTFVAASDNNGRKLYPIVAPSNANGTAASRFRTLDLGGVTGVPSWALPSTAGQDNNSWLFDPSVVWGWASAPQRLEFPGTSAAGAYAPVAMVDLAIWGYKAFANTDIGGVRQVIYDTTA